MTEYIGTFVASRILGVHPNTVATWFDEGVFSGGIRLPFSGWRRIPIDEVYRVLRERKP